MKLKVNFYKTTGKWAYGGIVDVGDMKPYCDDVLKIVCEKQNIITKGHERDFHIVVDNAEKLTPEEGKAGLFCNRLYLAEAHLQEQPSKSKLDKARGILFAYFNEHDYELLEDCLIALTPLFEPLEE